jgi:hypothetical protein
VPAFQVLHVDDVPPRPGAGTGHEWLALRHALDVRAFGLNAYRAPEAGVEVIESHTEADDDGQGQQELYVVLSGRARFTLDGEEVDAGAGTLVFLGDPTVRRVAVAEEPGTTILAVGGQQGVAFEPSEWEARWLAKQPAS